MGILNTVTDYLRETPAGYIARGDFSGAGQQIYDRAKSNYENLQTPEGAFDAALNFSPMGVLSVGNKLTKPLTQVIDKRFAKPLGGQGNPRAGDIPRMQDVNPQVQSYNIQENVPTISLADLEGRPFILSMSDRTSAQGLLTGAKGKEFDQPVRLLGGQGHMFLNPGQVWASGKKPVDDIMKMAQQLESQYKQNPVLLPWRMSPTGSDFAGMTGETMLNYANVSLTKTNKSQLDKQLKNIIPDWAGVGTPKGINQYNSASKVQRDAVLDTLDKNFRDIGGMSLPEARIAITDPRQLNAPESGLMYAGEIFAKQPKITKSGHPSYPFGVPGQGIGILSDDVMAYQLAPGSEALANKMIDRNMMNPRSLKQGDTRPLQMKPYGGQITPGLLKILGY
jgi:hypothetical protein